MEYNLSSEEHGGIDPAELKRFAISPDRLIDFSVNSNPFGPSPRVIEGICKIDFSRYPDRHCGELSEQLASLNGVSSGQILVGNGTAELIWLTVQALIQPGDKVLIVGPTFGEYHRASTQLGAQVVEIHSLPPGFTLPLTEVLEQIQFHCPRLVFLCNPNNPTGKYISRETVRKIADACGSQTILVLDEAYATFVNGTFFGGKPERNCLTLRSMTKDFALAGLRLGYAVGNPETIEQLHRRQPAWSVNAFAQAAGLIALSDLEYYRQTLGQLRQLQSRFYTQLRSRGFSFVESDVHFTLISPGVLARILRSKLLKRGLQVRDCASFGLPDYIRVSTRFDEENQRLLDALSDECNAGES